MNTDPRAPSPARRSDRPLEMRNTVLRLWWLPSAALLIACGCTRSPYDGDVTGTVTLDGKAVGPGIIVFAPTSLEENPSRGNIDDGGRYYLITKHARGLNPGHYRVAVQVYEKGEPLAPGERRLEELEPIVPKKYLEPETSGLEFEVKPGGNTIDIELTSE